MHCYILATILGGVVPTVPFEGLMEALNLPVTLYVVGSGMSFLNVKCGT